MQRNVLPTNASNYTWFGHAWPCLAILGHAWPFGHGQRWSWGPAGGAACQRLGTLCTVFHSTEAGGIRKITWRCLTCSDPRQLTYSSILSALFSHTYSSVSFDIRSDIYIQRILTVLSDIFWHGIWHSRWHFLWHSSWQYLTCVEGFHLSRCQNMPKPS